MTTALNLKTAIHINASTSKVWEALTNPELIKQYFFGTETATDWKKGSSIIYRGTWEGKPYEDKGTILDIETEKFITYNYWSSFSGTEDILENYANITYTLSQENNHTVLSVTQDGFKNQEQLEHSEKNWAFILDSLKKLVEK